MDTDQSVHDQLRVLGFYLVTATTSQPHQILIDDTLQRIFLDASKLITQYIPEPVRKQLYSLGTQAEAQFRRTQCQQILPQDSCFPAAPHLPVIQAGHADKPRDGLVEHDSSVTIRPPMQASAAERKSDKQNSSKKEKSCTAANQDCCESSIDPFFIDDLKLWAASPVSFLSSAGISIQALGAFAYIQALEISSRITTIARRFALLELWVSNEVWRPLPVRAFNEKMGDVTPFTLRRWLREGRALFMLISAKGMEVLFSKLKPPGELAKLFSPKIAPPDMNNFSNIADKSANYDEFESLLRSHYDKEANKVASFFDDTELELPKSHEDSAANRMIYREVGVSLSTFLRKLNKERLFGGETQQKHSIEVCQNEWPAKRICQLSDSLTKSPSDTALTTECHSNHAPTHNGTGNTSNAVGDGDHEARGAPTDESIPVDPGSQSGALVMPGSNSSFIATSPLEATAGGHETQPSAEIAPVRNIEADIPPIQFHSSPSHQQLNQSYLVENLDDCRGDITRLPGVSFGIHETMSQRLGTQPIPDWFHTDASSIDFDTTTFEPLGALEPMEFNDYQGELNAQ